MFNFPKKNAIFSVALSIGSLLVPVFFAYAETPMVTPEIIVPSAPVVVVVPQKISSPIENKKPNISENIFAFAKDFSAIFTDGFAIVGNDVKIGMLSSAVVYKKGFSETNKSFESYANAFSGTKVLADNFGSASSQVLSTAVDSIGTGMYANAVNYSNAFSGVKNFVSRRTSKQNIPTRSETTSGDVAGRGSLTPFETFGNVENVAIAFFSNGATVIGNSFETAFASTKNSYASAFASVYKNVSNGVGDPRPAMARLGNLLNINQIEIIGAQNLLTVFADGSRVIGGYVAVGVHKNFENIVAVTERNIPTRSETTSGGSASPTASSPDWVSDLVRNVSSVAGLVRQLADLTPFETFGNVANVVTSSLSTGVTVIGNSFETAFVSTKNSYAGAFVSVSENASRGLTRWGNVPNINQIEITGAQNLLTIFTDGFGVVGNTIGKGMTGSVAVYKNLFVTIGGGIKDTKNIFVDGAHVVGGYVALGANQSFENYAGAFSGTKNLTGGVAVNFSKLFDTATEDIGTGMLGSANVYDHASQKIASVTKILPNINQIEIIGAQNLLAIFTDGFAVVGNNVGAGMMGSVAVYKNLFATTIDSTKHFGIFAKNILVDGTHIVGGYVAVGVHKNFENIVAVAERNIPTHSESTSGGSASPTASSPDAGLTTPSETFGNISNVVMSSLSNGAAVIGTSFETAFANTKNSYAGVFASVSQNVPNGVANPRPAITAGTQNILAMVADGFAIIADSIGSGILLSFETYGNAFQKIASVTKNIPNINQIEIIGAQNLLAIFTDGFAVVRSDVKTGMFSSVAMYANAYRGTADTLTQIGNAVSEKTSNFAVATLATRSSWDSFWCWAKGLFGFECPALNSNVAVTTTADKNVSDGVVRPGPAVVVAVPSPSPDVVPAVSLSNPSDPVRNVSPVAVAPAKQVLSYSSILASLKNIFAPISLTDILGARITALEKKSLTGGASSSEILALQNQINAINASRYFSPSYSYTPTAMIGGNGQAVVFNASGPNGVFENGVTAQTGTFTSGITAGSFSTAGTLSVTGATTLSGAFNGGNTLYIDAVNGRVGIGTSTPTDTLSVNGPVYLAPITPSATIGRLYNNGGDLYWAGNLIGGAATGNWVTDGTNVWRATGNVGIGTTTPGQKLSVAGDILGNNFIASYFTATTSTATSTIAGNFAIDGTTRLATSLTGVLKSVGGYVTASLTNLTSDITGILGLSNGGTGTSTAPTYGKVLIGNSGGTYDLNATSTLGLMNSLGAQYSTAQSGSAQTFATSSDTNIGLTIVSSGNVHTFTPTWIGTLANNRLTNSTISGIALGSNLADLTATDGTLTFSGSYNGGLARTIGLNLTSANTWTALQQFNANASTTQLTVTGNTYLATASGNVGIGTTSPYSKLSVWGTSTGTNRMFELTNSASTTLASFLNDGTGYFLGNIGIGTTSPYAKLSVVGQVLADYFTATSTTATSTFAGNINVDSGALTYTQSSGIVDVATLTSGQESFETNAGIASWMDLPVDSTPVLGTVESYIAQIDGNALMTMYSESLGDGNVWKMGVGIGTTTPTLAMFQIQSATSTTGTTDLVDVSDISGNSYFRIKQSGKIGIGTTTPYSKLSVWSSGTGTGQAFEITDNASTTIAKFLDNGTGYFVGNVGIGTTTPGQKLSVAGDILGNNFIASYFTATTSTATSTLAGGLSVAGTSGLTVLQNGNVGIGTASPLATLVVNGNVDLGDGQDLLTVSASRAVSITNLYGPTALSGASVGTESILRLIRGGTSGTKYNPTVDFMVGTHTAGLAANTRLDIKLGNANINTPDTNVMSLLSTGNVGIGTTSPYSKLSVWGTSTGTNRMFELTNSASTTLASFLENGTGYFLGNIGIGTTSPYAKLSVVGQVVADYFSATSTTATSTFAGNINVDSGALTYTQSSGVTDIATLSMGAQSFESDAGVLSWADMPVSSASVLGTVNSYSAQIDSNPMLTIYSESLEDGNTWKNAIGIGTTTPIATLSIQSATSTTGTTPIFDIAGLTGSSFMQVTASGLFSVTGTTTIGTTGQMAGLQIGNGGICVDSDGSCTASTTGRISSITSTVGATDLAENYSSTEALEPGDVVATRGGATVGKANSEDDVILGIVSTNPGVLLGFSLDPATTTMPTLFPIALSGRVPVKVSNENGAIKIGDRLALSSQAGVAMKATENGQTVGIALEDYSQEGTSKILTFVSLSWYQTLADAVTGDVPETKTFFEQIVDAIKDQIITFTEKITALKGMIIGSSEKPAGITIYDEETKEPFCIKVKNGTMINEPGVCDKLPEAESVEELIEEPIAEEPTEDPTCTTEQTLTDGVCVDNNPPAEEPTEDPTCTDDQTLTDGVCVDNAPAEAEEPTEKPTCAEGQTQEIDGCIL